MIRRPPRSTLFSLHDALPIYDVLDVQPVRDARHQRRLGLDAPALEAVERTSRERPELVLREVRSTASRAGASRRSEEHTSELQSRLHLVCRLLLEKEKRRRPG